MIGRNPYRGLDRVAKDFIAWADTTIPQKAPVILEKMWEEVDELRENPHDPYEAADVLMCLIYYCHLKGIDLVAAFNEKLDINKKRTWTMRTNGTWKHQ